MTDLLAIGTSGLRSARAGLAITGNNVANAQTPGYVRRRVVIEEMRGGEGTNILYRNRIAADGSYPAAITRATDMFRVAEARTTAGDAAQASTLATWLRTGEASLGDDMTPALATMFASGERLAASPGDPVARVQLDADISTAAGAIGDAQTRLARTTTALGAETAATIDNANTDLGALAKVNLALRRTPTGTSAHAELSDARDRVLDRIAIATGARIAVAADGTAIVSVGGVVRVDVGTVTPLDAATAGAGGTLGGLAAAAATLVQTRAALDQLADDFDANVGPASAPADLATHRDALLAGARAVVAGNAVATASARDAETRAAALRDAAAQARDGVEGVDLDTEAAELLRWQQAYGGAARVIQVARDTLDTIFGLFR